MAWLMGHQDSTCIPCYGHQGDMPYCKSNLMWLWVSLLYHGTWFDVKCYILTGLSFYVLNCTEESLNIHLQENLLQLNFVITLSKLSWYMYCEEKVNRIRFWTLKRYLESLPHEQAMWCLFSFKKIDLVLKLEKWKNQFNMNLAFTYMY